MLSAAGKPDIVVGSPPEFKGEPDIWAPEELLVGSRSGQDRSAKPSDTPKTK